MLPFEFDSAVPEVTVELLEAEAVVETDDAFFVARALSSVDVDRAFDIAESKLEVTEVALISEVGYAPGGVARSVVLTLFNETDLPTTSEYGGKKSRMCCVLFRLSVQLQCGPSKQQYVLVVHRATEL